MAIWRPVLIWMIPLGVVGLAFPNTARAQEKERQDFIKAVITAKPAKKATDGVAGGKLGTRRMKKANYMAAEILKKRMKKRRNKDLLMLRRAGAADVVVVRGTYDRVQDVLKALKLKHVVIPARLVAKLPLMSTQTLMVNCPGRLNSKAIAKVRQFVKTGGFLVTTDWALTLLTRAFPGYVKRGKRNTSNDVVKVHVHETGESLLSGIKAMKTNPRWWLEGSSYPIRVLKKDKVKVLISSKEMRRKYGHSPIAVTFRYDDGKVLHMTSHFYLQQAKLRSRKERAKGSSFAASAGLSKKEVKALKAKGLDSVKTGELNSAYSMQQMTANVVVDKAKDNKKLLKKYKRRARRNVKLKDAKGRTSKKKVGKDYILREIKRKGKKVKVRDLFGNEGWVADEDLL